jgi:sodium pump decarboxylase gamma subunit
MRGLLFAFSLPSGDVLKRALENTVMGISIVFCMLLLICFIISLLKLVNKIGRKKPAAPVTTPVVDTDGDGVDDLELVAVITAAIYEYEKANGNDVEAGGLVVRSIRKVNKSKWQNA